MEILLNNQHDFVRSVIIKKPYAVMMKKNVIQYDSELIFPAPLNDSYVRVNITPEMISFPIQYRQLLVNNCLMFQGNAKPYSKYNAL